MQLDDDLLQAGALNVALRNCAPETRSALFSRGSVRTYEPGDRVVTEGEQAGMAVFPLRGKFQLAKTAANGRRQVFCYMEPGGCNHLCMFLMADRSLADIYAVESSQLLAVSAEDAIEILRDDPRLSRDAWIAMTRCLGHFVAMVENLSFHKVSERVALALLDATIHNSSTVRRTQAELAAEVGTTREVVARCLAEFQDSGAIRLGRGRIVVLNRELLQTVA